MRKQVWLDGLKDAETLHISHQYTVKQLKAYISVEGSVVMDDHRWNGWREGFNDFISNLEFRQKWNEGLVSDVTNIRNLMLVIGEESKIINR